MFNSVDPATEAVMQRVIETECQGLTLIAVIHNFQHIERYDQVALVDDGKIVEYDTPAALLSRDSQFSRLYHIGFS